MPRDLTLSRPTKSAQALARAAARTLGTRLSASAEMSFEVELEPLAEPLRLPREALELMAAVLEAMGRGRGISIVPLAAELTTQAAADMLGCSRPHVIKLLEAGVIPYTKVGRHRRLRYDDVAAYAREQRDRQRSLLGEMMADDEDAGLYTSASNDPK